VAIDLFSDVLPVDEVGRALQPVRVTAFGFELDLDGAADAEVVILLSRQGHRAAEAEETGEAQRVRN
jgi:hypothetical protein